MKFVLKLIGHIAVTPNYVGKVRVCKAGPSQFKEDMASTQGQDVIRCQLCPNPVEHHCNLCHVDLCFLCVPQHMADWFPVGLSYTVNVDLLVSMRSMDKAQSRVLRYSGKTEIQKIQFDSQGQPLFSTGVETVLHLIENGNADVCVADYGGMEVVVVDSSGKLRFKYQGNLSPQSKYKHFRPSKIAADVNTQILMCDNSNDVVHIIDCDGNFVRYIEHSCCGGISIDADHNLLIADGNTGKIQIVKYLE